MMLEAQICDVWGDPVAGGTITHTVDGGGITVHEPLNDSRTCELTLSCHDPVSRHAKPLSRMLSVTYGPFLIFKGPILQTSVDFAAGTIQVSAHDMTIRLKHHYHRYGDYVVDVGYPVDGFGMRLLVESSIPVESQSDRGVPPNGIMWGYDFTTHQGPRDGDGLWRPPVQRGTNVWESIQNLSQIGEVEVGESTAVGPDFRFRPVDPDHLGNQETVPPGFCCELDTNDRLGQDRTDTCIFEHGQGTDNAENVTYEPDGDMVRNWFIVVYPGGERNRGDSDRKALVQHSASEVKYGLMQGWESGGQKDTKLILRQKAKAWIGAYHEPPDFFTVTPRVDRADNVPRYGYDFDVGDVIRARAKTGEREVDLIGRIVNATISAVDQAGNVRVTLDCVPTILADFDEGDEED